MPEKNPTDNPPDKPSVSGPKGQERAGRLRQSFAILGPGVITGAADDDPSGISTYSVAGAAYGYATLWIALLTFPLMSSVQLMCARLGMVTGQGLAAAVRDNYPRWVLWGACSILVVANVINIGADLGGMAEATQLVTGIRPLIWIPFYALLILGLLIWTSYKLNRAGFQVDDAGAFRVRADVVFRACGLETGAAGDAGAASGMVARISGGARWGFWGRRFLLIFFSGRQQKRWKKIGLRAKRRWQQRKGASAKELKDARTDTVIGMFFSNFIMYFIILTTGATLHAHGQTNITTAREAAEALRPLAGNGAYCFSRWDSLARECWVCRCWWDRARTPSRKVRDWRGSMSDRPKKARAFYGVMAVAMALGFALNYLGLNAVKMLFWSAVINGLLAPPLILLVILLTSSRKVMGEQVNSPMLRCLGMGDVCGDDGGSGGNADHVVKHARMSRGLLKRMIALTRLLIAAAKPTLEHSMRRWLVHLGALGFIPLGLIDSSIIPLPGSMDVLTIMLAARSPEPVVLLCGDGDDRVGAGRVRHVPAGAQGGREIAGKAIVGEIDEEGCETF